MEMVIKRFARCGRALHGRLLIDGEHVCDTLENAVGCLPPGRYLVRTSVRRRAVGALCATSPFVRFVASNGPCRLGEGDIALGECRYLGFLIHTQENRVPVIDRVRKATSRHKTVTVIILPDDDGFFV